MEIVYFANTPRPLPRVTEPSSVSVSPRFRLQLGLLVHLGRCLGAPNQTERDGKTRVKEGEEETRGRKEIRVRKRNPAKEKQEEKRDTTNQSKAHLARATDSPRFAPAIARILVSVLPVIQSRANPAKITVLNHDCG